MANHAGVCGPLADTECEVGHEVHMRGLCCARMRTTTTGIDVGVPNMYARATSPSHMLALACVCAEADGALRPHSKNTKLSLSLGTHQTACEANANGACHNHHAHSRTPRVAHAQRSGRNHGATHMWCKPWVHTTMPPCINPPRVCARHDMC